MVAASLDDFRAHLLRASLYAKWKGANPGENAAIMRYWDGRDTARPTGIKTEFGLAFLAVADAYVEATKPAPEQGMPYPLAPITV